jgi:hypothetical protein
MAQRELTTLNDVADRMVELESENRLLRIFLGIAIVADVCFVLAKLLG